MITGRQIRAGRALLGWDANVLAEKAGLKSAVTVRRLENDEVQPQEATLAKLIQTLDSHGVEFIDDEGVRIRKNQVRYFSGRSGYKQFLDHIYQTVKSGGIIRQFNISDSKTLSYVDDYAKEHVERMEKIEGLDARVLTVEGDTNFPAGYCTYRWMDKSAKILIPFYLYNDYIAQATLRSDHNVEIISTRSKMLAERYIELFDSFWGNAIIPGSKKGK